MSDPSDHSTQRVVRLPRETSGESGAPGRKRRRRSFDWRSGGSTEPRWDWSILAVAFVGLGVGAVTAALIGRLPTPDASLWSSAALWGGLGAAVVFALVRARPAGLFRLRTVDLLWGIGLGLFLRAGQGLSDGVYNAPFPALATLDGQHPLFTWISSAVPGIFIAPVLEELFFRAVVLVAIYQIFRRSVGTVAACMTAVLMSTGGFVLLHAINGALPLLDGIQLFAVGATCGILVILTGRISGAIIAHIVYNGTYFALLLLGTVLA